MRILLNSALMFYWVDDPALMVLLPLELFLHNSRCPFIWSRRVFRRCCECINEGNRDICFIALLPMDDVMSHFWYDVQY